MLIRHATDIRSSEITDRTLYLNRRELIASATAVVSGGVVTAVSMVSGGSNYVSAPAVTIGGVSAQVLYAGGAPGQIAGLMQVNVVAPSGLSGAVPVVLTVGGLPSQPGVTVAVR